MIRGGRISSKDSTLFISSKNSYTASKLSTLIFALLLALLFTIPIQPSRPLAQGLLKMIPPPLHASKLASTLLTTPSAVAIVIAELTTEPCSLSIPEPAYLFLRQLAMVFPFSYLVINSNLLSCHCVGFSKTAEINL